MGTNISPTTRQMQKHCNEQTNVKKIRLQGDAQPTLLHYHQVCSNALSNPHKRRAEVHGPGVMQLGLLTNGPRFEPGPGVLTISRVSGPSPIIAISFGTKRRILHVTHFKRCA